MKRNFFWYYGLGILFMVLLVFLDQYTKVLAVRYLKEQGPYVIIENVFSLQYLENIGAAFGMLANHRIFFIVGTVLVFCVVCYFWVKIPKEKRYCPLLIAGILVLSGAIGNFIDRVRVGYVVDFFYFEPINFPIFNVADSYVVIAIILFIFLLFFYYKDEELSFFEFSFLKKKER